jgi:hypothetical protein
MSEFSEVLNDIGNRRYWRVEPVAYIQTIFLLLIMITINSAKHFVMNGNWEKRILTLVQMQCKTFFSAKSYHPIFNYVNG